MRRFLVIMQIFTLLCVSVQIVSNEAEAKECVILLHGMGRTKASMSNIEDLLSSSDYIVWNETYPSTEQSIEIAAISHIDKGLDYCSKKQASKIHFVTHSLGGILIRYYLQEKTIRNLGNIVMLSPPNQGSEVVDYLKETRIYKWITGPAGQQLGTTNESLTNTLSEVDATVGIIAGKRTSDPWFSPFIPGDDDGKVSVERTKLNEMSDFLVVESGHTSIMNKREVINQVKAFLVHGKFNRSK